MIEGAQLRPFYLLQLSHNVFSEYCSRRSGTGGPIALYLGRKLLGPWARVNAVFLMIRRHLLEMVNPPALKPLSADLTVSECGSDVSASATTMSSLQPHLQRPAPRFAQAGVDTKLTAAWSKCYARGTRCYQPARPRRAHYRCGRQPMSHRRRPNISIGREVESGFG